MELNTSVPRTVLGKGAYDGLSQQVFGCLMFLCNACQGYCSAMGKNNLTKNITKLWIFKTLRDVMLANVMQHEKINVPLILARTYM